MFTLSIPSHFNLVCYRLTIYYFKSFKPNGSARHFRKRVLVTLRAFIRVSYLAQWLNPPPAALLFKILFLAMQTSALILPPPRAITLPTCHMLPLLLLLCRSILLCSLWPDTWRMTSSKSLWPFWILDLLLLLWLLHLNSIKARFLNMY